MRSRPRLFSRLRPVVAAVAIVATVAVAAGPASATWSIVAADPETGEVGVAIASCVPARVLGEPDEPLFPVVLVPGAAAGVAQAELNVSAPPRIAELVAAGETPSAIVGELSSVGFDADAAVRQHAVVAADGTVAAFTGADTLPESLDRHADGVSVQGNLLADAAVVDDALAAFRRSRDAGDDLTGSLVAGLVAGSEAGGDRRCEEQTALFAQVAVAAPGDEATAPGTLLTVLVAEQGENPVDRLAAEHAAGRSGVVDLAVGDGSAGVFRVFVLVLAAVAFVVAVIVFRRGLGSVTARR